MSDNSVISIGENKVLPNMSWIGLISHLEIQYKNIDPTIILLILQNQKDEIAEMARDIEEANAKKENREVNQYNIIDHSIELFVAENPLYRPFFQRTKSPFIEYEDDNRKAKILNINPDNIYDANVIKQAFRKLSAQYHPDNAETGCREKFEEIVEAKNYLLKNIEDYAD